jgi:hypothetical protein
MTCSLSGVTDLPLVVRTDVDVAHRTLSFFSGFPLTTNDLYFSAPGSDTKVTYLGRYTTGEGQIKGCKPIDFEMFTSLREVLAITKARSHPPIADGFSHFIVPLAHRAIYSLGNWADISALTCTTMTEADPSAPQYSKSIAALPTVRRLAARLLHSSLPEPDLQVVMAASRASHVVTYCFFECL